MTKILNIDDLIEETRLVIVADGVEHKMKTATMQDFLQNMKDIEALSQAPGVVAETEATVRMIARAFPTLTEEQIMGWSMDVIQHLFDVVRGADEAQVETEDASGNAPSAT